MPKKDDEETNVVMEGAEEEPEVVVVEEGEGPPEEEPPKDEEKERLREQLAALQKQADSATALTQGVAQLGETLKGREVPQAAPQQQPGETREAYQERVNKQLFADNPLPILEEVVARTVGPALAQANQANLQVHERLLELDPDEGKNYRKWKKEVQEIIATLPPGARTNPNVFRYAYDQVKARHTGDLVQEQLDAKVEEAVARRLKEMGIDPAAAGKTKPFFSEGQTRQQGAPAKKRVYATANDIRRAEALGVDLNEILSRKGGK